MAHQGDSVVTIDEYDDERGAHLTLRGRLDRSSAADVRLSLRRTIAAGASPLHVDLADVVIGDATGIGVLVEALRCARRAQRPMLVVAADPRTTRLMRRARLGGLLVGGDGGVLAGAAG